MMFTVLDARNIEILQSVVTIESKKPYIAVRL